MDKLDLILQKLESLKTGQNELVSRLKSVDEKFQAIDERFQTMEENFHNRFQAIDDRFQTMDDRFQAIDDRFQAIDNRFQAIDDRFQTMDDRFQVLEAGQKELHQITSAIRHRQEMSDAKLDQISADIHFMRGELTAVRQVTLTQERRLRAVEDDLSATTHRVEKIEHKLNA